MQTEMRRIVQGGFLLHRDVKVMQGTRMSVNILLS
jgi:hypothetical protein